MLDAVLTRKNVSFKFKITIKTTVSVGLIALAVILPQIIHATLGASGGAQWLPMYLPVVLCKSFYVFLNLFHIRHSRQNCCNFLQTLQKSESPSYLGFSAHGEIGVIQRFLEKYGQYMEFGQLQINYLDWEYQTFQTKLL